jgi:hypothetical protein
MTDAPDIHDVKRRHSVELLSLPGVSGVGVAKGESGKLVIALHLDENNPAQEARLPKEIEGVPVEVVHSGPFRKL